MCACVLFNAHRFVFNDGEILGEIGEIGEIGELGEIREIGGDRRG